MTRHEATFCHLLSSEHASIPAAGQGRSGAPIVVAVDGKTQRNVP